MVWFWILTQLDLTQAKKMTRLNSAKNLWPHSRLIYQLSTRKITLEMLFITNFEMILVFFAATPRTVWHYFTTNLFNDAGIFDPASESNVLLKNKMASYTGSISPDFLFGFCYFLLHNRGKIGEGLEWSWVKWSRE